MGYLELAKSVTKKRKEIDDNTLAHLFNEALREAGRDYRLGLMAFVRTYQPEINEKIEEAYNRIDEMWLRCNRGEATMDEFQRMLDRLKTCYGEAMNAYNDLERVI